MVCFSILTPNLNGGDKIQQSIDSLVDQNVEFEHLVMDGGSTDESLNIIEKSPSIIVVSREDQGSHDAFRKGVLAATGDVLGFLNSDDVYLPHVLERVGKVFDENQDIGAVCGECIFYQGENKDLKFLMGHTNYDDFFNELAVGTPCFNGWFVRREVALQAGNFNSDIDFSGDRDFLVRVYLSAKVHVLHEPVYGYWMHSRSRTMSKNRDFMLPSMYEHLSMIDAYLTKWPLSGRQKNIILMWQSQALLGTIMYLFKRKNWGKASMAFIHTFRVDILWWARIFGLLITKFRMKKLKRQMSGVFDLKNNYIE